MESEADTTEFSFQYVVKPEPVMRRLPATVTDWLRWISPPTTGLFTTTLSWNTMSDVPASAASPKTISLPLKAPPMVISEKPGCNKASSLPSTW